MTPLINPTIEQSLREKILPELSQGRQNFDLNHTEAVVHWMKQLLVNGEISSVIDSQVMITAAYAHDWGYVGLFKGVNSDDPKVIKQRKPLHMQLGAKKIKQLIEEKLQIFFSSQQADLVVHLVNVHDEVEELQIAEELLLMEADTLGMLDVSFVTPTFTAQENLRFVQNEVISRRFPKFTHPFARLSGEILLQTRLKYYGQSIRSEL
jgi:hypothetical protein